MRACTHTPTLFFNIRMTQSKQMCVTNCAGREQQRPSINSPVNVHVNGPVYSHNRSAIQPKTTTRRWVTCHHVIPAESRRNTIIKAGILSRAAGMPMENHPMCFTSHKKRKHVWLQGRPGGGKCDLRSPSPTNTIFIYKST